LECHSAEASSAIKKQWIKKTRPFGDFALIAIYPIFTTLKYRIDTSLRKMSDTAKKEVI
jgi:hypothetical protein